MEDKIFTPAQVADRLQVAEKTVYRWLDSGKLKGVKLGRLWRIREEKLEEFLQKNTPE
ncbi:helix-turn-helix domain-containing protein [Robertmurraya sp.]|uniref:helix-turn-helix domain-containing protein n=1 Tax=Robertmurraya sp. TaxID=2837525 RepID=UPI003704C0F8